MDVTSYLLGKNSSGGGKSILQSKSVEITENGTTNVVADSGYDGLDKVEVITNVSSGGDAFCESVNRDTSSSSPIMNKLIKNVPSFSLTPEVTSLNNAFNNCPFLISVGTIYNISQVTDVSYMFSNCGSLETAPQLDISNATNLSNMFAYSSKLKNVPQYNFTKATDLLNMFRYCNSLSDDSMNNILASCTTAINYTSTKTLKAIGFTNSSFPARRIQTLSNYQDFLDAGWTIGY